MSPVALSVQALDALRRGFAQAPAMAERELLAAMTHATLYLEREVKERMPKASGLTAQSIHSDAFATPVGVLGTVGSAQASAAFVELGTRAHPVGRQGREALALWAKTKLGVSDKEAARVAFAVARKIARQGTRAQKPFAQALEAGQPQVLRFFEAAAARVAQQLAGRAA